MAEFMCPHCHAVFREKKDVCPNDGSILIEVPVLADLAGKVLKKKYKLDQALGHGGFGSVYKATHLVLGKSVAVKVLRAEFRNDQNMVARFFNEARVVTRLTNPHTINTFDLDQAEEGFLFMVMDFVEGQTLRQLARAEGNPPGRLPWQRAVRFLIQVCDALIEAHKEGVVHRDLKPDNVMISNRGGEKDFVTVLDFGIAKVLEGADTQNLTAAGMLLGSPAYMSPEQVKGIQVTPASDIYSLGVIAYQIITGTLPVTARQTAAILHEKVTGRPESISRKVPDLQIPIELEHLVMETLEVEESARPPNVSVIRDTLVRLLREHGGEEAGAISGVPLAPPSTAVADGTRGYQAPIMTAEQLGAAETVMSRPLPDESEDREDVPVAEVASEVQPSSPVEPVVDETFLASAIVEVPKTGRRFLVGVGILASLLVVAAVALFIGMNLQTKTRGEAKARGETKKPEEKKKQEEAKKPEEKKKPEESKKPKKVDRPVKKTEPEGIIPAVNLHEESTPTAREIEDEVNKEVNKAMKNLDQELDEPGFGSGDHIDKAFDEMENEENW